MSRPLLVLVVLCLCGSTSLGFAPNRVTFQSLSAERFQAATLDEDTTSSVSATTTATNGLLKRDRYVATNRFAVRSNQHAKFEKRWATRKSRLAVLPGFKYFHLMRRVKLNADGSTVYDQGSNDEEAQENYVSFTIWEKKSDFSAWRSGDAFKEAHGGTSIGAFLSTMINSAFVLRGPPRPAFYDGILLVSIPPATIPETVDGWRDVQADGITTLPAECFVTLQKYWLEPDTVLAFEQFWANRESNLKSAPGFVGFSMLRRDGQAKGHGIVEMTDAEPNYTAALIFQDRDAAEKWNSIPEGLPEMKRMSERVFYEGTLVISSLNGP
jgi:heme-degrading monooxygenase HmoA